MRPSPHPPYKGGPGWVLLKDLLTVYDINALLQFADALTGEVVD